MKKSNIYKAQKLFFLILIIYNQEVLKINQNTFIQFL